MLHASAIVLLLGRWKQVLLLIYDLGTTADPVCVAAQRQHQKTTGL